MDKYANMLLDELSGKIAKDQALEIAKFHRVQASPGFHDSAVYVQDELRKIGIKDAVIEKFPADGKTKYWTYDAIMSWWATTGEITMVEPRNEILGRFEEHAMSLATHSKSCNVIAEAVDVGEGNKEEDYAGKDLNGKIAIQSGNARAVHLKAIEHGAIGTIHHPPWNRAAGFPDLIQYNGIWPDPTVRDNTTFGFAISDRQYQDIKRLLDAGKTVKVHCKTDARLYDGSIEILTAKFTGTERPQEEIVLIAHLCHPKTCTNDNASGSGVLVEIARSIKALVDSGKMKAPKRTIRLMWVPEINGTVAWMHGHKDMLRNIHIVVNLDMVGEHPVTVGWALNLVSAPDSTPTYLNPLLIDLLKEVGDDHRGVAMEGWPYGLDYRVEAYAGGSDHVCFCDKAFGIPSVMFYNPDHFHHTSFDEASRMDSSKMKRVGVVTAAAALTVANADEKTALQLAAATYAYGCKRITETGVRAVRKLMEVNQGSEEHAIRLGTAYLRGARMLDEACSREIRAVNSVQALSGKVSGQLGSFTSEINDLVKAEKRRLQDIYESAAKNGNLETIRKERDRFALEAQKLVPKRAFEGPSRGVRADRIQNDDDKKWLAEFNTKHSAHKNYFLPLGGADLEMMNFADGKRTVYDIAIAASTEYDDIEPAEAKRFFDICKSIDLIDYV